MPNLATVTLNGTTYDGVAQIQALSGGDVELPGLTQLSGGPVQLESDGTGSKLNISGATSFQQTGGFYAFSSLQITNGGTVVDPDLSQLNGVNLIGDRPARSPSRRVWVSRSAVERSPSKPERCSMKAT